MSEMLEFLRESKDCRTVIIEKLDRLARDLVIQEGIIAKHQNFGLEIFSTCEPDLCSNDPSRKFVRQILGAVAELDRSLIVAKLKSARDRIRAETGKCEGRKRYGTNEYERNVLAEIRAMKARGVTDSAITTWLNMSGIKPRFGKKWHPATIARIRKRRDENERGTGNARSEA
jgi:DNA invertase Pin-like site-specific DNA recombinase